MQQFFQAKHTVMAPAEEYPDYVVQQALLKQSNTTGTEPKDHHSYILKVCGREEYLLGNYPICQYQVCGL